MNRKRVILLAVLLALMLSTAAVAVGEGEALLLRWNSGLGGGSGGGNSTSASFRLTGSSMGAISVSSDSASFDMCVGFLCAGNLQRIFLPFVVYN
jgi:hypothetical protein